MSLISTCQSILSPFPHPSKRPSNACKSLSNATYALLCPPSLRYLATMTISIDKIVDGFPHPNIAPIVGIPTYESIAELNLQLNANAASVQSNLGDGQLGLLALTVSPAVFNTLSAVAFVHPVNPGTNPVIPPGGSGKSTSRGIPVFLYCI
jgi:hypothetical protein